jgi:hypothetical protein
MITLKTNLNEVISYLESIRDNPKPLMLEELRQELNHITCPEHGGNP